MHPCFGVEPLDLQTGQVDHPFYDVPRKKVHPIEAHPAARSWDRSFHLDVCPETPIPEFMMTTVSWSRSRAHPGGSRCVRTAVSSGQRALDSSRCIESGKGTIQVENERPTRDLGFGPTGLPSVRGLACSIAPRQDCGRPEYRCLGARQGQEPGPRPQARLGARGRRCPRVRCRRGTTSPSCALQAPVSVRGPYSSAWRSQRHGAGSSPRVLSDTDTIPTTVPRSSPFS